MYIHTYINISIGIIIHFCSYKADYVYVLAEWCIDRPANISCINISTQKVTDVYENCHKIVTQSFSNKS